MSACREGRDVPNHQRTRGEEILLFARNFLRHPKMLGSMIPSSRFLVQQVLQLIDWNRARVIVEYGPGVGGITAELLRRMRPDASLIAIEVNSDFVQFLQESIPDPRLRVVQGSAADVEVILRRLDHDSADYVISGIPFSTMPATLRESILRRTRAVLEPNGVFLVYQFSTRVLADLRRIFGRVQRRFEPLNVLPAHLFYCEPRVAGRHPTEDPPLEAAARRKTFRTGAGAMRFRATDTDLEG